MALRADDPRLGGVDEAWWDAFEPPPGHRAEIIGGALVVTPSPAPRHVVLQHRLYDALRPSIPDDLLLVSGLEWRLAARGIVASAPQPDLMVVRLPDPEIPVLTETPMLTVEIISPADGSRLRGGLTRQEAKRVDYATNGVGDHLELWFDHEKLVVDRYELDGFEFVHVERAVAGLTRSIEALRPFLYRLDPNALWPGA
jgi:Uma2 family endonuclease